MSARQIVHARRSDGRRCGAGNRCRAGSHHPARGPATAHRLIAVDKDRQLIGLLRAELLAADIHNVDIREADILRLDLTAIAHEAARPLVVLGNLPYNISSQVIVRLIHARHHVDRAVLMLQKEMAQRICAGPGSKNVWPIVGHAAVLRRGPGADAGQGGPVFPAAQGGFNGHRHPFHQSAALPRRRMKPIFSR